MSISFSVLFLFVEIRNFLEVVIVVIPNGYAGIFQSISFKPCFFKYAFALEKHFDPMKGFFVFVAPRGEG